jgi:hypothetical protein
VRLQLSLFNHRGGAFEHNIGMAGQVGRRGYTAGYAYVAGSSRGAAHEYVGHGITDNCSFPGFNA